MKSADPLPTFKASIVVTEDEEDMARILEFNLTQRGHAVNLCGTAAEALERVRALIPDLMLLDLRLPDGNGLDVLRELRDDPHTAAVPVIIVSALGDESTVVEGINMGAEDYVTKPFRLKELMARVDGVLRRRRVTAEDTGRLSVGDVTMDVETMDVTAGGENVDLTRSEFELLLHFVRHPNRVFTRQQLCHQALGAGDTIQERTIDAHIRTVRRKLGDAGRYLVTVWGIGYKFTVDPDA